MSLKLGRECGECIACCTYLKIPVLEKKGLSHCKYSNLENPEVDGELQYSTDKCNGCTTYDERPEVCKGYSCMWLAGYGEDDDRPDKSLMLIDTTHKIENAVECKPLSEFAADSEAGKKAINNISQDSGKVALVTSFYETRLVRVVGRPE